MKQKESTLVSAILTLANMHRDLIRLQRHPAGEWSVGRFRNGEMTPAGWMRGAEEGWPDLSGFVPAGMPKRSGKAVLIECKAATSAIEAFKLTTQAQRVNLGCIVASGGIGILAWDVAQFWSEYLDAVGMEERGGLIVPIRKKSGRNAISAVWKKCECRA